LQYGLSVFYTVLLYPCCCLRQSRYRYLIHYRNHLWHTSHREQISNVLHHWQNTLKRKNSVGQI
jgi:hypothetical protein